jgi:cell division protease FtsH
MPPPPPRWRNWLLSVGIVLPTSPTVTRLSYSQLKSDIAAGQVVSVALSPDGSISGQPTNGSPVRPAVGPAPPANHRPISTDADLVGAAGLLPLAVIVALSIWSGRAASRQLPVWGDRSLPGQGV